MGCAGSKEVPVDVPAPSDTPAAEAAPPPPGRQKSAMKSSSSSGVKKEPKEAAPKVGFIGEEEEKARRTKKDELPVDEDQVDLELERADGLRTGSSGQQYQISRTAEAKLSDTEFGGSDSARDRAKSFANYGKPPVASVVVDGVSQKSPSGSAEERFGLRRSNSTTGVSMPKNAVGNWVMVPTKTGSQKSTQDRYRRRSTAVEGGGGLTVLARAPSLRPASKGGKAGLSKAQRKTFEAAPPGRVLASEERESARARLRAALVRHWLFESFDSKQIEATAKAMRHQSVPQGKAVSAQGEAATKFYVVTEGGFDLTVATEADPAVLVAQAGPSGTFNSKALMGKGEARVTATAAVHSEVFVLTRDVFVAIKSDKGDGDGRQGGTARRLEALQSVPCLAQLPAGTLSRLEAAATEVTLAPDANPCAEATDNWLLLITGGRLELSHAHAADGDAEGHPAKAKRGALMARFELEAGSAGEELLPGDLVASGRRGEEELIGALSVLSGGASTPRDSGGRTPRVRLLQGAPGRYKLAVLGGEAATAVRLRLRDVAPILQGVPAVVSHQLGVRGLLECHPLFAALPAATLDKLSFAASARAFSAGQRLTKQGATAEAIHVLLSGSVGLSMRLPADHRLVSKRGTVVQCGVCEAGGVVGHTSIFGASTPAHEALDATTTADTLTLCLDRASARSLLPEDVVAALRRRRDEAYLWGAASQLGAAELQPERIVASGSFGTVARVRVREGGEIPGEILAAKKVPRSAVDEPGLQAQLLLERAVMASMCHPYICKLRATLRQPQALFLLMQLCDGPNVYEVLEGHGPFEEGAALQYAACLVSALAELHASFWAFRDLKADNVVFVSSGAVMLVDFGLAKRAPSDQRLFTVCGSIEYMAPEVISSSGHGRGCDWWSLGCLLYELVIGHTPWMLDADLEPTFDVADAELSRRITAPSNVLAFPEGKQPSAPLCDLLAKLLVREVDARLGCSNSGVRGVYDHPAFAAVDFKALEAGTLPFPAMPTAARGAAADGDAEGGGGGGDSLSKGLREESARRQAEAAGAAASIKEEPKKAGFGWEDDEDEDEEEEDEDEGDLDVFFADVMEEDDVPVAAEWDRFF